MMVMYKSDYDMQCNMESLRGEGTKTDRKFEPVKKNNKSLYTSDNE
jgi:hypothetical protein